jgi:hypothetical protein
MDDKRYIKEAIEHPATRGEAEQSMRLKRMGVNPADIDELRNRLDVMRNELHQEVSTIEEKQNRTYAPDGEGLRKRGYDGYLLIIKPLGIIRQLLSYGSAKRLFLEKYGAQVRKRVSWSIWYLFTEGVLFFPSIAVYSHVQDLIRRLEELRPIFRKMYSSGWLNAEGADVLTPLEFNIVAETERLVGDTSVVNYLINFKRPGTAIEKMNPFLGHYISITRDEKTRVVVRDSAEKSLLKIVYPDGADPKLIKKTLASLDAFLDGSVDREVLVPLFECAFCRAFDAKGLRDLIKLRPIDTEAYRADPTLLGLMSARKKKYLEMIKSKAMDIENRISLVLDILEATNGPEEMTPAGGRDLLEELLNQAYHYNEKVLSSKLRNIAIVVSDLCDVFFLNYASCLTEEIKIKQGGAAGSVRIFKNSLFIEELNKIEIERHLMTEFIKKTYGFDVFTKTSLSPEEAAFMNVVNSIVDCFYSIGMKLYSAIKGHRDHEKRESIETVDIAIDERRMGNARIPYAQDVILGGHGSAGQATALYGKSVMASIQEIKRFCFCFAGRFEHRYRDLSASGRGGTIASMIAGLDELYHKLEHLQKGENVE